MKKLLICLAISAALLVVEGCAYPSEHKLLGPASKYSPSLLGKFKNGNVEIISKRVDDYTMEVSYKDYDGIEEDLDDAVSKFVTLKNQLYVIVSDEEKYLVGRVSKVQKNSFMLLLLDEKDVPKDHSFSSDDDFTDFVLNNSQAFKNGEDRLFTRQ